MKTYSCAVKPRAHQTVAIRNTSDLQQLCDIATALASDYLSLNWIARKNEGVVTLKNPMDRTEVIHVFKDYDNKLALQNGLNLHTDPVAVAVTLCEQPALARRLMRDELRRKFQDRYLDPGDSRYSEYYLLPPQPQPSHFDIMFLSEGPCPFDEQIANALSALFAAKGNGAETSLSEIIDEVLSI